jgi:hypothetical protein
MFKSQKRKKELARQKKQEEKRQKRLKKDEPQPHDAEMTDSEKSSSDREERIEPEG